MYYHYQFVHLWLVLYVSFKEMVTYPKFMKLNSLDFFQNLHCFTFDIQICNLYGMISVHGVNQVSNSFFPYIHLIASAPFFVKAISLHHTLSHQIEMLPLGQYEYVLVFFWILSIALVCLFIYIEIPHCLNQYSFIVSQYV